MSAPAYAWPFTPVADPTMGTGAALTEAVKSLVPAQGSLLAGKEHGKRLCWLKRIGEYALFINGTRTGCVLEKAEVFVGVVQPSPDYSEFGVYLRDGDEMREYDTLPTFELACDRLWQVAVATHAEAEYWATRAESEPDNCIPL